MINSKLSAKEPADVNVIIEPQMRRMVTAVVVSGCLPGFKRRLLKSMQALNITGSIQRIGMDETNIHGEGSHLAIIKLYNVINGILLRHYPGQKVKISQQTEPLLAGDHVSSTMEILASALPYSSDNSSGNPGTIFEDEISILTSLGIDRVVDAAVAGSGALLQTVAQLGGLDVPGSRRVTVRATGLPTRFAFLHPLAVNWADIEKKYPGRRVLEVHVRVDEESVEAVPGDIKDGDKLIVTFF